MMMGMRVSSVSQVESDLAALKSCAERAGASFACLFSSSDEFEADVIRNRLQQRAQERSALSRLVGYAAALSFLSFVFLML